ncbi:hypothetical protein PHPALM_14597 [Phytophthora palmivora]|uniref:CCHC-type domain-containing protein n=1 Tax=Phytophthora palmivora TaxID=4796 RepID=A0A2P4XUB8_9STRA|nr:hypothetical protein PHPALM_14597 [Phytophthora palmivora]
MSNMLEYLMEIMLMLYKTPISSAKGTQPMVKEKESNRERPDNYQHLVYVAERSGNSKCCTPVSLQVGSDHLQQALKFVVFAIEYEASTRPTGEVAVVKVVVIMAVDGADTPAVVAKVTIMDKCHECDQVGHLKTSCPKTKEEDGAAASNKITLANTVDCDKVFQAANGGSIRVRKIGIATLRTLVNGSDIIIDLCEVYYAENLLDNIIYGRLEKRCPSSSVPQTLGLFSNFEKRRCGVNICPEAVVEKVAVNRL